MLTINPYNPITPIRHNNIKFGRRETYIDDLPIDRQRTIYRNSRDLQNKPIENQTLAYTLATAFVTAFGIDTKKAAYDAKKVREGLDKATSNIDYMA